METVANSLPENKVIILIFFILRGYKSYTDLQKFFVLRVESGQNMK